MYSVQYTVYTYMYIRGEVVMWEFFHIYLWTQQHKLFRFFNHVLLTRVHYGTRIYACKPCTVYTIYIYMYKVYYGRSWYVVLSVKSRELPGLYILPIQATKAMISGRPSPQTSPPPSSTNTPLPPPFSAHPSPSSTHPTYPSLLSVLIPPIHLYYQVLILTLQCSTHLSIHPLHYSSHLSIYLSMPSNTHPPIYLNHPVLIHYIYLSIPYHPVLIRSIFLSINLYHPVYLSSYKIQYSSI